MTLRTQNPPDRPLLIYDGACCFCRFWIEQWQRMSAGRVDIEPRQTAAERFPEIPPDALEAAVHFVGPDGVVAGGAEAVLRSLACAPGRRWPLGLYRRVPGAAPFSEWCYRLVATHRARFDRLAALVIRRRECGS